MLTRLHLRNVGPAPEMEIHPAPRLNLITGDNGLGKSFLLDVAWWAMTRRWPREVNSKLTTGYPARPTDPKKPATIEFSFTGKTKSAAYTSTFSPRDEAWLGKAGRPANPGLVIYAHSDGGFSVWDPARNYWKRQGNIDVQERLPAYVFSPQEVWEGLRVDVNGREVVACNGLLQDWAAWIREGSALAQLMSGALEVLSPSDLPSEVLSTGPLTRLSVNDARDVPSIRTGYAGAVPIVHASSGVRRILALAYMLLWARSEHMRAASFIGESTANETTLLIDEVESHLHPRWQRSILNSLLQAAYVLNFFGTAPDVERVRTQVIAVTHSPLVLASAEPHFNPQTDAWFDLDLSRSSAKPSVELRKRQFVRHGDVSNWLTSEAFDLKEPRSLEAEKAITHAMELLKSPEPPALKELQIVDHELRRVLGEMDPFWVRWSARLEQLQGAP